VIPYCGIWFWLLVYADDSGFLINDNLQIMYSSGENDAV